MLPNVELCLFPRLGCCPVFDAPPPVPRSRRCELLCAPSLPSEATSSRPSPSPLSPLLRAGHLLCSRRLHAPPLAPRDTPSSPRRPKSPFFPLRRREIQRSALAHDASTTRLSQRPADPRFPLLSGTAKQRREREQEKHQRQERKKQQKKEEEDHQQAQQRQSADKRSAGEASSRSIIASISILLALTALVSSRIPDLIPLCWGSC